MRRLAAALLQEPAACLACNCLHHLSPRPLGGNGLPREVTSSLLRSACGRTASQHIISITNIVRIDLIRLHLIGNSANIAVSFVDTVEGLYVGSAMYFLDTTLRGEAPGAAPSRRQRGPRS